MKTSGKIGMALMASAALLFGSMTTQEAIAKESAERPFHQALSGGGLEKIVVETVNGDITVLGGDRDSVIIDAEIIVVGKKQEWCDKLLGEVEIEAKEHGGELSISADHPKKHGYSFTISFTLAVPISVGLEASSVNGALNVSDINGGAEVSAINGQVTLSRVSGPVEVSTINGRITLGDVSGDVEASTINGAVSCENRTACPASVDFSSINGPLELTLPAVPDADVDAETMSGSVSVEGVEGLQLKGNPKSWSGKLGSGKGHYEFSAVNGSISIEVKREAK